MEKSILKRYTVTVFSDGSIETEELLECNDFSHAIDYSKLSSRISQILMVLDEISRIRTNQDIEEVEIFTSAIKNVANELGVENTSVADKLGRQLGETAESIRTKIFDAYKNNNSESLKQLILKNASSRNKQRDTEEINYYFNNIFN